MSCCYTLSKCTDYNSGNRDAANEQAMNPYDPSNNEGPCAFDIRHNFNLGGSYSVPGTSVGGAPVQVGTVFSAVSGRPFTPGVGTFDQSGQNTGQLRADCLANPIYKPARNSPAFSPPATASRTTQKPSASAT